MMKKKRNGFCFEPNIAELYKRRKKNEKNIINLISSSFSSFKEKENISFSKLNGKMKKKKNKY